MINKCKGEIKLGDVTNLIGNIMLLKYLYTADVASNTTSMTANQLI